MLLSVVIPVYNREEYIKECIDSVLNQNNPGCEYEVIVVDDGSTDNTPKILNSFGKKITYKRIQNSGRPAVPRNLGIELAKGEYIAFQDSDDLWVPNKLKLQFPKLLKSKAALSYGNAEIIDVAGKSTNNCILNNKSQFLEGMVFDQLVEQNYIPTLTTMLRKDVLTRLGGFDESNNLAAVEDYHLWLRIAAKYPITSVNMVLAKYRSHNDNISTQDPLVSFRRQENMINNLLLLKDYFSDRQLALLKTKLKTNRTNIADHSEKISEKLVWKLRSKI